MADFSTSGCDTCRSYWLGRFSLPVTELGLSREQQATYLSCDACGALWEYPMGSYPAVVATLPDDLVNGGA